LAQGGGDAPALEEGQAGMIVRIFWRGAVRAAGRRRSAAERARQPGRGRPWRPGDEAKFNELWKQMLDFVCVEKGRQLEDERGWSSQT